MHGKLWTDMFALGVPVAEKMLRPVFVYLFLVVGLRLAGKRELAQLNPFDLVVLLTLSNTVQNAIIGDDNSVTGGVLGATTLLLVNYLVVRFLYRHPKLDRVAEGQATPLMRDGRLLAEGLSAETISEEELLAAARRQGFDDFTEINEAVLEPGGVITFTRKKPPVDEVRHNELIAHMEQISRELATFRSAQSQPPA